MEGWDNTNPARLKAELSRGSRISMFGACASGLKHGTIGFKFEVVGLGFRVKGSGWMGFKVAVRGHPCLGFRFVESWPRFDLISSKPRLQQNILNPKP